MIEMKETRRRHYIRASLYIFIYFLLFKILLQSGVLKIFEISFFSGNLLLVGNVGNHLSSLVKLALYLADIQLLSIDCSRTSLFYDSMRTAIRTAGSENKAVGLIFSVNLVWTLFLFALPKKKKHIFLITKFS